MKSMKIEINENQSVEDVVRELQRIGYKLVHSTRNPSVILASKNGGYGIYTSVNIDFPYTTLSDLRKMERVG